MSSLSVGQPPNFNQLQPPPLLSAEISNEGDRNDYRSPTDYSLSRQYNDEHQNSRLRASDLHHLTLAQSKALGGGSVSSVDMRKQDFLSDLAFANGAGVPGDFPSPSLQAAAALAAHHQRQQQHHQHLYRSFANEVSSSPPPNGHHPLRLRSPPPISFSQNGPSRHPEESLSDSRSLGALLREIAGVPHPPPSHSNANNNLRSMMAVGRNDRMDIRRGPYDGQGASHLGGTFI